VILYRGTPYPEDWPILRDYECVFFADDPYAAANYGDHVQAYDVGTPRLLDFESEEGARIVREFLGLSASHPRYSREEIEIGIHPTATWVEYLHDDLGFDGYMLNPEIICLFEPYLIGLPVRLVGRRVLQVR